MKKRISLIIISTITSLSIFNFYPSISVKAATQDIPKSSMDFNGDGIIDLKDITQFISKYNLESTNQEWDNKYDLNKDNTIDIYDLVLISKAIDIAPKIASIETSSASPQKLGKMIHIEPVMKNSSSETLYRFSAYFNGKWQVLQDYSKDNSYNWQPAWDTNYIIKVDVKNENSKSDAEDSKQINYEIQNNLNIIEPKLDFVTNGPLVYENVPKSIVLHHIQARFATVYDIHRWHMDRTWAGIGYHYYIRYDGSIYRGRPESAKGAHCPPANYSSIGIACEGDFMVEKSMTSAQKKSLIALGKYIKNKYNMHEVYGHKDLYSTDCPGTYFPLQEMKNTILR